MSRNIVDVANKMIELFGDSDAVIGINEVLRDVKYTAPELMYVRWGNIHEVMLDHLPASQLEWTDNDIEIVSVFTGTSISEIKKGISSFNEE